MQVESALDIQVHAWGALGKLSNYLGRDLHSLAGSGPCSTSWKYSPFTASVYFRPPQVMALLRN
jgi:hypothetical protein